MGITDDILDRVAEAEECDPLELPPLYHSIDADALERCVASADSPVTLRFRYYDYTVTVRGEEGMTVEIKGSDDSPAADPVQ